MNIVCERCNTVYRFDAARLPPGGKKVQCSQCNHVFVVKPPNANPQALAQSGVIQLDPALRHSLSRPTTTPAPQAEAQQDKRLILRQDGTRYSVKDMATLQRWIMERRITRDAELSEDGNTWVRVGDRPDLASYFSMVERAPRRSTPRPVQDVVPFEPRSEGVRIATAFQKGPAVEDEEEEEDDSTGADEEIEASEGDEDEAAAASMTPARAQPVAASPVQGRPVVAEAPAAAAPAYTPAEVAPPQPRGPSPMVYAAAGGVALVLILLLILKALPDDDPQVPVAGPVASLPAATAQSGPDGRPGDPSGPPLPPHTPPPTGAAAPAAATPAPTQVAVVPSQGTSSPASAPAAVVAAPPEPTPAAAVKAPPPTVVAAASRPAQTSQASAPVVVPAADSRKAPAITPSATAQTSSSQAGSGSKEDLAYREAKSLAKRGDYERAAAKYREAIEANPRKAQYWEDMGWAYMELSDRSMKPADLGKAEEAFKRALSLEESRSGSHFGLGRIYQRLGRTNDAIRAYELCIKYRPDGPDAQEALWFLKQLKSEAQ